MTYLIVLKGVALILAAIGIYHIADDSAPNPKLDGPLEHRFSSIARSLKEIRALLEIKDQEIAALKSDLATEKARASTALELARAARGEQLIKSLKKIEKKEKKK